MKESNSLKPLQELGSSYFRDGLFKREEKVMSYGKQLTIGKKRTGAVYYLDLREACRMIIIGKTRSGKTWLLREMADRLKKIGYSMVFLPDVKDEFKSSKKPVQEKFRQFLLEGETPEPMNVVTLRPTFFKQIDRDGLPSDNYYYSISLGALSKADFNTLMNTSDMTAPQQIIMELIFERIAKQFKETGEFSFENIDRIIDEMTEINATQKTAMKFKFRPLKSSFFYEKKHQKNIIEIIKRGYHPAINMEGFDSFGGEGSFRYPEVFVGMVLRMVINARRAKVIQPLFIMVDEASRFIPADKNPSCKRDFMESCDLDTRYNINYAYATQEIEKIPIQIVKQCRYIFVPHSADVGTIRNVLMMSGLVRNQQTATNDSIHLKGRLKRHEWIVFDLVSGTKEIVKPISPLSEHMETSN